MQDNAVNPSTTADAADAEMLANLLHKKDAARATALLTHFGGLANLARQDDGMWKRYGLTDGEVSRLHAALWLGARVQEKPRDERPIVKSPADIYALLAPMGSLEREEMGVLLLDTKYRGSLHTTVIRVTELFRTASMWNAAAIVVFHNHPSGDPCPSPEDVALTREIAQAAKILDIDLLDHIVIGDRRFVSLKERGLGFG